MELVRFLLGSGSILLTDLLLATALMGIGLALRHAFGLRRISGDDCFLAFWIGFAGVVLFLLLWNFWFPVSDVALLIVLTGGALGLLKVRGELVHLFDQSAWRPSALTVAILVLAALWLANLSLGPLESYDSALYHLQSVQWAEQYPAIPGIGNLDGPLAFNNSNILYDALLSAGPWQGRSNHLANGLLVLVFLLQGIVAVLRLAAGDVRPRRAFEALLLAPATSLALHGRITSFITDLGPSLVLLVAISSLYAALSSETRDRWADSYAVVTFAILLALAVSLKSNAAVFAATSFPLALLLWLRRRRPQDGLLSRTLAAATGAVLAIAVAWMGRGIVLSGFPVFPTPIAGIHVEWKVPQEHAAAEFAYIVHSGRASTKNLAVVAGEAGFRSWFPNWTRHLLGDPFEIVLPLSLAIAGGFALLFARRRSPPSPQGSLAAWVAVPLALAILAWFLSAPEPRYALPYFWALAALTWGEAFRRQVGASGANGRKRWVIASVLLGIAPAVVSPLVYEERAHPGANPLVAILKDNLSRPGTDSWVQPIAGRPELKTYRTRSGLLVYTAKDLCWDAPLPCTPNPAPNLRLRDPSTLRKGFVVEGPWQMENWPLSWQPHFLEAWRKSRTRKAPPGDNRTQDTVRSP